MEDRYALLLSYVIVSMLFKIVFKERVAFVLCYKYLRVKYLNEPNNEELTRRRLTKRHIANF